MKDVAGGALLHSLYRRVGLQHARRALRQLLLPWAGKALRSTGGRVRNRAGLVLFVDPSDRRARQMRVARGTFDDDCAAIWDRLVREIRPDVLVDIGANYGEIAFSRPYHVGVTTHLVEANPTLIRYLRKTAAVSARGPVVFHEGAASDTNGKGLLSLSQKSSGEATLQAVDDPGEQILVPRFRLDSVIQLTKGSRWVFKLDVEGHEVPALRGMSELFKVSSHWAGICELLHQTPDDLGFLHEQFDVWLVERGNLQLRRATVGATGTHLAALRQGRARFCKDVVLRPLS